MATSEPRPIQTGPEQDAFGTWGRKYLCYMQRAGVRKGIKRDYHRKERRWGQAEARRQASE